MCNVRESTHARPESVLFGHVVPPSLEGDLRNAVEGVRTAAEGEDLEALARALRQALAHSNGTVRQAATHALGLMEELDHEKGDYDLTECLLAHVATVLEHL